MSTPRRVLFVDDEQRVLDGLRRLLRNRRDEWDMRFVTSASEALDALAREPADVVVTDFRMPGTDGGGLLSALREHHPGTARLVLSGHTDDADLTSVASLAHQFLTKPCDPQELYEAVSRALQAGSHLAGDVAQAAVASIEQLPSPSAVVLQLLAKIDAPEADARLVAGLLQSDVGLSTKVLQVVNSSFFAPRARITGLEPAVARLGLRTVRSLVCMHQLTRALPVPAALSAHWLPNLNRHAELTAGLARRLAAPARADDAFCAGLLHECGQLVFAASRPTDFIEFLRTGSDSDSSLGEREVASFGMTHEQAGVALLNLWGFPPEIAGSPLVHSSPVHELRRDDVGCVVRVAHHIVESQHVSACSPPEASELLLEQGDLKHLVGSWRAALQEAS